jgi:5-methylcytosine-specific restriction endonuclease McrA
MSTSQVWETIQNEFACDHESVQIVRFTKSNGVVCVREQCWRCGTSIREVPKKGHDIDALPEWNETIRERWYQMQRARRVDLSEQKQAVFEQEKQQESAQWWTQYNRYLHSQHWHDIRQKVLERDSGLCQACLKNKATQVHHISYALYQQLGKSAAFELVAICYPCHCAIHPQLAECQRVLSFYNPYLNGGNNGRN